MAPQSFTQIMAAVIGDNGVDVSDSAGSEFLFKRPYIVFIARENYRIMT